MCLPARVWPPALEDGATAIVVPTEDGLLRTSLRVQPTPEIFGKGVHAVAGTFSYELVERSCSAYRGEAAIPTLPTVAVPKRIAEHVAGRYVAALATIHAGHSTAVHVRIGADKNRAPTWPSGYVGSIAHSDGRCIAAVASSTSVAGVGVDVERIVDEATVNAVGASVWSRKEQESLSVIGRSREELFTLAFSAKESVYKALAPIVNRFFYFDEVEIDFTSGLLSLRVVSCLGSGFDVGFKVLCRFAFIESFVFTGVSVDMAARRLGGPAIE